MSESRLKVVHLSDTHNHQNEVEVPDGDLLIFSGDMSGRGTVPDITSFNEWLGTLPHKYKIVIAGNHDFLFETQPSLARSLITNAFYIQDSGIEIRGVRFWGTPWTPTFYEWAFMKDRGSPEIFRIHKAIPDNVDVLISHGAPANILDETVDGDKTGCQSLLDTIRRIKPKYVLFGHIHEAYGRHEEDGTIFLNSSVLDECYRYRNKPQVFEIVKDISRPAAQSVKLSKTNIKPTR